MEEDDIQLEPQLEARDKPPTRKSRLELIAGLASLLFGGLWLVFFVDAAVMPLIAESGVERTVPDLRRMQASQVDSLCTALGLQMVAGRSRVDEYLPDGSALDQFPRAGSVVKPGRRVEVVFSSRLPGITVPRLVGRAPRDASLMADSMGFSLPEANIGYNHSEQYPEGVVIFQSPPAGTTVAAGDSIRVTVSLGPPPKDIRAPGLVGSRIDAIGTLLIKSGLRLGEQTNYPDRNALPGTILSQDPPPGTPMTYGQTVAVKVAIAPAGR